MLLVQTPVFPSDAADGADTAQSPQRKGKRALDSIQDAAADSVQNAEKEGAADRDSATFLDSLAQKKRSYDYIAYPTLQLLTWPIEKFLVPAVNVIIYPTKKPLQYFITNNVIDRSIELISFGEKDQVQIYPTMSLATGTGSYTGVTMRHVSPFGRESEKFVGQFNFYVNGDWKIRSYLMSSKLAGTPLDGRFSMTINRFKTTSTHQPGTNAFWYYADTSDNFALTLSYPILDKTFANLGITYKDNQFGRSPPQEDQLISDFFKNKAGVIDTTMRGLNEHWKDYVVGFGISRNSKNNDHITINGSEFSGDWSYHFTDASHDFHQWRAKWTGFFKLGKEKYEISSQEERDLGKLDIRKVLENIEIEKLRDQIFNRKVVVMQLYTSQSYEVKGNHAPVYALNALGNSTPLRGYGGNRFRDWAVAAISTEYRFPVLRLVDGVIFNEYGNVGKSLEKIDHLASKNSWGFGIRVRRPDLFLFRAQLGFHGREGIQFNLSVDDAF